MIGTAPTCHFIERLCFAVKEVDPEGLVTYVNYPSTEYLQLPFLDLACFNVYLESEEPLPAYLRRLHNIAGERPLMITELGHRYDPKPRFYRRSALRWPEFPNALPEIPPDRVLALPSQDGVVMIHDRNRTVAEAIERALRYAPAQAQAMIDSGQQPRFNRSSQHRLVG